MKQRSLLFIISSLLFSVALTSCHKAKAQEDSPAPKVVSTELIRTSQSWDGVELPDYFQGRPELVAVPALSATTRLSERFS